MSSQPEPVILIIADISGYTRYMAATAKTLAHSQAIITELVCAIVKQVQLPLVVAKLEGDAVFFYGRKQDTDHPWPEAGRIIAAKLIGFFKVFAARIIDLRLSTTCACAACSNLEQLKLKLVVHSGEALFHEIAGFQELAGVDVIIVHRLLKNSLRTSQYLLMTEAACADLHFPSSIKLLPGTETYEELGTISTRLYLPEGSELANDKPKPGSVHPASSATRWFFKLWFRPLAVLTGKNRTQWHHLPDGTSMAAQWAFALLTLLLTPIYVPVGLVTLALRRTRTPPHQHPHPSEHPPDCKCPDHAGEQGS